MSLLGSLQLAGNTLQAMQIGLQVVGNNIANANTPGYVRERTVFTPGPVQQIGRLSLGTGVTVAGIVQVLDKFVEGRLRDAGSDRASADVQEKVYRDLQAVIGELTDTDLSSSLSGFFNTLDLITETPEDVATRNLAILNGNKLATDINTLDRRVRVLYEDFSNRVVNIADQINTISEQVRRLNLQIVTQEGGGASGGQAGGLRSQRNVLLKELGELVDINVTERETGSINVTVGGEFLVFEGTSRTVRSVLSSEDGLITSQIQFTDNNSPLIVGGGELQGIYEARDTILGGFLDQLDGFAASLANEFNKVYSQGQGITGFSTVTSEAAIFDPNATLDAAGLDFTPVNGTFDLLVRTQAQDSSDPPLTSTYTIAVDLNGLDGDLTLNGLVSTLDAIDGISARLSPDNELILESESEDIDFSFSGDTSGLLAALGINTFFTGSDARQIGVNSELLKDASKFAGSLNGIGVGGENVLRLIRLNDEASEGLGGRTISGVYDQLINETTQGATITSAVADGLRVFEATLDASAQAVSGVSLDEEAIDLIQLQRTYQASARFISTISELLDILVNL